MPNVSSPTLIDTEQAKMAWAEICQAENIAIISHKNPDPDSLGSNLALRQSLVAMGKNVRSFCVSPLPQNCLFLNGAGNFSSSFRSEEFDLIISVDCGSTSQVAYGRDIPELFSKNFLNIDHHASNDLFGTINLVNIHLSSTCEIIYLLHKFWGLTITPSIATCLMFGLYYDTGSFMHSSTTDRVMDIAGDLMASGADFPAIINNMYHNFSEQKFHIWGQTMENIKVTPSGTSVAVITPEDIQNTGANSEDLTGLIDYVSMVKQSEFAVLISQEGSNRIKGSLRTRKDTINLSNMAEKMGGGGHRKASGFGFPGKIEKQTIWKITP